MAGCKHAISFSFASFYNADRMNFGALRVLNDDIIAPNMGFGAHPHDNMENYYNSINWRIEASRFLCKIGGNQSCQVKFKLCQQVRGLNTQK